MNSFYFYNPTKIIFGKGMIKNITREIPLTSKILLVYGRESIKKNGVYNQIKEVLGNYELYEFGGIEPNPEYELCMEAVKIVKEKGINYILAAGGGSVIDAAKFIALSSCSENDPWEFLNGRTSSPQKALPFGCIQTLPATGSEMNNGFVISRRSSKDKLTYNSFYVYPKFSVLDPDVTMTIPAKYTSNGIVDMYVHILEQYLTDNLTAVVNDRQSEALLMAIKELGLKIIDDPLNYETRENIMWCGVHTVNGMLNRGIKTDWATHEIGHVITALYGIEHAETLALILDGVWNIQYETKKDKLAQYGKRVWNLSGDSDEIAKKSIYLTVDFFEKMGLKTKFSDYNLDAVEVAEKVCFKLKERDLKLGENKDIDLDKIKKIIISKQ